MLRAHVRNFKSKSGTRNTDLLVPLCFPKFVSEGAAAVHGLRKRGTRMPWSTPFDEPIALRGGRKLMTLQHAADYIMKLPEHVQQQERWQIAVENLINAAETGGGWLMFARIGVMRALNGDGKGR